MRRLHRFLRLTPADRQLLVEAALNLAAIRLALGLFSFQTVLNLLTRMRGLRSRSVQGPQSSRIIWAVESASRHVPGTNTCLIRALAAHTLLNERSRPARLQIGVAKGPDGKLQAHAWVESDGKVLIGGAADLDNFRPLSAGGVTGL